MNWSEFFAMGGYAQYVWPVYVIAAVVLALNVVQPLVRQRAVLKRLRRYYRLKSKAR
jgi:heme exporter protein CcmD